MRGGGGGGGVDEMLLDRRLQLQVEVAAAARDVQRGWAAGAGLPKIRRERSPREGDEASAAEGTGIRVRDFGT